MYKRYYLSKSVEDVVLISTYASTQVSSVVIAFSGDKEEVIKQFTSSTELDTYTQQMLKQLQEEGYILKAIEEDTQ